MRRMHAAAKHTYSIEKQDVSGLTSLGSSGNTRGKLAELPPTLVCSVSAARHSTKRSVRRRSSASLNTTDQGDLGALGAWKERSSSAAHSPITEFMVDCGGTQQQQSKT
jgi:hypothetical protein